MDQATLISLIRESQNALCDDKGNSESVRQVIKNDQFVDERNCLLLEIQEMMRSISLTREAEEFYSSFYKEIVMHSTRFFPGLDDPLCTSQGTKLADNILVLFCHEDKQERVKLDLPPITKRELDGLQYVGGYGVSKLLNRAKSSLTRDGLCLKL